MNQTCIKPIGGGVNSHNVFNEIISLENLFLAWKEFKRGKKKKLDIQEFEFNLENNLFQLHNELKSKTYQHGDYTSFNVTDPKLRRISKANVKDRVLHHAVFRILYPIFDRSFIFDSYSCRLGKGTHKAVNRIEIFCRKLSRNTTRTIFALKCDIKKFFDSIGHDILLNLIRSRISNDDIWLISKIIDSFHKIPNIGLPLGNVTSQLFANIYLNELDQFVKHNLKERYYLRYCDDFIVLGGSKEHLSELINKIGYFLANKLGLYLHPDKILVRKYHQGIDFLGYVVLPHHIILRIKTKRRMLKRIISKNSASYLGILKHCNGFNLESEIFKKLGL